MAFGQIDILQVKNLSTQLSDVNSDIGDHIADTANPHAVTAAQTGAIAITAKGAADGVAELDFNGKVPASQIPAVALERVTVVSDEAGRFALTTATVQNGDVVKQVTPFGVFVVSDDTELDSEAGYVSIAATSSAPVDSVFGRIGVVVAAVGDYGSDEITNDSTVSGTYVTAALDNLKSAIENAIPTYTYLDLTPTGTVNGSNTDFTLKSGGVTATAVLNEFDVYVNNLWQEPGVDYTMQSADTIIRFAVAPVTTWRVRTKGQCTV